MLDKYTVGRSRMRDFDISFSTPFPRPVIGDRVACWAVCAPSIAPRGFITRQGHVVGSIIGADDSVVAYAVQDEVSGETIYASPSAVFIPDRARE